jgi:hypothetical protein
MGRMAVFFKLKINTALFMFMAASTCHISVAGRWAEPCIEKLIIHHVLEGVAENEYVGVHCQHVMNSRNMLDAGDTDTAAKVPLGFMMANL